MTNAANSAVGGDNTAYAVGYLGREANPKRAGGDLGYRYVKLDGRAPVLLPNCSPALSDAAGLGDEGPAGDFSIDRLLALFLASPFC